jgi:hypothetical protein
VFSWLRRKAEPPLTGAPPVRRVKTYSAASGFVYEYWFEGRRPARRGLNKGVQFVFSVTADRRHWFPVSVFVSERSLRPWEQAHQRQVTATECYAVAKMSLFRAFDERPSPDALREEILVEAADVAAIFQRLGLD